MISPWYQGIQIMFKFTKVTFGGQSYVTTRTEKKIRAEFESKGRYDYTAETVTVPASNLLMIALGWQGGTIHQVQSSTELSIQDIQDIHNVQRPESKLDGMTDYYMGYHIHHMSTDLNLIQNKKEYWRGAIEAVIQYRKDKILDMINKY